MDIISCDLSSAYITPSEYTDEITEEQASITGVTEDKLPEFIGLGNVLYFRSASGISFCGDLTGKGVMEIGYYLDPDKKLCRREDNWSDSDLTKGGESFEIASNVEKIEFEYFDGQNWPKEWNSSAKKKLPSAVKVTMTLKERDEDFVCVKTTIVAAGF